MASISEQIRQEVRSRKLSLRKIHLATGLERVVVRRFMAGKSIYSSSLDKLAEFLGVEIKFPATEAQTKTKKKP